MSELSYLTQVIFRLFEDREDPAKFRCEILLSPGATGCPLTDKRSVVAPYTTLNKSLSYDDMISCLDAAINAGCSTSTSVSIDQNEAIVEPSASEKAKDSLTNSLPYNSPSSFSSRNKVITDEQPSDLWESLKPPPGTKTKVKKVK